MPIPTRAALKALFQTGDHPSEADFATLVDAIYDLSVEASDAAAAAVVTANSAAAFIAGRTPKAWARIKSTGGGNWTLVYQVGCLVVLTGTKGSIVTVTFDPVPLADANYSLYVLGQIGIGGGSQTIGPGTPDLTSKTAAAFALLADDAPVANGQAVDFIVWR